MRRAVAHGIHWEVGAQEAYDAFLERFGREPDDIEIDAMKVMVADELLDPFAVEFPDDWTDEDIKAEIAYAVSDATGYFISGIDSVEIEKPLREQAE